ncbi:MAG: phosphonate ABC transporter [Cyanobacteriota bacterium]|nr:phosphonate ABC transporter [Cyanobacteriota bacterium]
MRPALPLLPLLPALVLLPLALVLPGLWHGGGVDLLGRFALAALSPSLDPRLLRSLLEGLGVTVAVAVLGWITSLLLGLGLAVLSARVVWQGLVGTAWPALVLRRVLAVPRAIHELIWGLLLLQVLGLRPEVAILAITIPFAALVARVMGDQLDGLPRGPLDALRAAGAPAPAALVTALGPPLVPALVSYGGYRLECALRSATVLGVFGLGGLGTELRLTMQSLEFHELWSGLWLLLAVMLLLETGLEWLRRRWWVPRRLGLTPGAKPQPGRGRSGWASGQELLLLGVALLPLAVGLALVLGLEPASLLRWRSLPPLAPADGAALKGLPWPSLVAGTLGLTLLAASLAVGLAPLLLGLVAPWRCGRWVLRAAWALGRLWPPPLIALLLLFVLKPGVVTAALALGLHNLGILGRLLMEAVNAADRGVEQALTVAGAGPRLALLHGRGSEVAGPYLAYGAYRADVMLRETVVVGLVGATGLGSQLLEALSAFAWDQVLAVVGALAVLTLLGEALSDHLRHQLPPAG